MFLQVAGAKLDFFLLAPPAPNSMLEKLTLALRVLISMFIYGFCWRLRGQTSCVWSSVELSSQCVFFFVGFSGAKVDFVLLVPTAPNSMLKKLTLVVRVLFLDFLRVFPSASGATLDVSGPVLR